MNHVGRLSLVVLIFAAGCVAKSLLSEPIAAEYRRPGLRVFVQNHGEDRRNLERVIAEQLSSKGLVVSSGLAADRPAEIDLLVVYEDRWQWDMSNYLIFMRIDVRDPMTNVLLATGSSYQTSLARKSPEAVIALIVPGIFPGQTGGK